MALTTGVNDLEVGPALGSAGVTERRAVGGYQTLSVSVAEVHHLLRGKVRQTRCKKKNRILICKNVRVL